MTKKKYDAVLWAITGELGLSIVGLTRRDVIEGHVSELYKDSRLTTKEGWLKCTMRGDRAVKIGITIL